MSQPVPPADEELLRRLGALAGVVDPAPAAVHELGRAAFALRRLDDELAELVADSDAALSGVRGAGSAVRLLTFEVGARVVEVQVSAGPDGLAVLGQVVPEPPGPGGTVRLQTPGGAGATTDLDALGGFRFPAVPPGLVRLTVELPAGRPVTTAWVTV